MTAESSDADYIAGFLSVEAARGICAQALRERRRGLQRFSQTPMVKQAGSLLSINPQQVQDYCRHLREDFAYAPQTIYGKTRLLYDFYQWLVNEGVLLLNPVERPTQRRARRFVRPHPSLKAVRHLLDILAASHYLHDRRSVALVDLAYSCGLRRSELVRLNVHDVNPTDGTVRVLGKGGKERFVPVGKKIMHALLDYIYNDRPIFLHGKHTDALFVSWAQGGRRISTACINDIFKRLRRQGLIHSSMTTHALRHAFATHMLKNGAPVQDVSEMLGHASLRTTQIYTHLVPTDLKEHHKRFHPRGG